MLNVKVYNPALFVSSYNIKQVFFPTPTVFLKIPSYKFSCVAQESVLANTFYQKFLLLRALPLDNIGFSAIVVLAYTLIFTNRKD